MDADQVIAAIVAIRESHSDNLMARHFNEEYFLSLDNPSRQRLTRIIASGIENPDSNMGAYAMHPDDYEVFTPMFDPMIRDFHGIPAKTHIAQRHDWNTSARPCDLGAVDKHLQNVSMRVRVARNLSTLPLPGAMTKSQRVALEEIAAGAFKTLSEDPKFGGGYLSITPGSPYEISSEEYDRRVQMHQMFKNMSGDRYLSVAGISGDWPYGRGMYVSETEDFLVWVGEEDHLRIMSMQRGGNLNELFDRLRSGLDRLEKLLPPFATSPVYGNVSSCPTNLGTSMRASLHMQLPGLTNHGQNLDRVKREAVARGLAIRGVGGEHSAAGQDGLVDISPSARLGLTEVQIMGRLFDGAAALRKLEANRV